MTRRFGAGHSPVGPFVQPVTPVWRSWWRFPAEKEGLRPSTSDPVSDKQALQAVMHSVKYQHR